MTIETHLLGNKRILLHGRADVDSGDGELDVRGRSLHDRQRRRWNVHRRCCRRRLHGDHHQERLRSGRLLDEDRVTKTGGEGNPFAAATASPY